MKVNYKTYFQKMELKKNTLFPNKYIGISETPSNIYKTRLGQDEKVGTAKSKTLIAKPELKNILIKNCRLTFNGINKTRNKLDAKLLSIRIPIVMFQEKLERRIA
ncbi:MAG: hypothetical protein ACE14Q_03795 [Acidobacteriota bacterium]